MSGFADSSGTPRGAGKIFAINWSLVLLIGATCSAGFLMLYSVAGGSLDPWARAQMIRFGVGMAGMLVIALIPIRFWHTVAPLAYGVALALLVLVEIMGTIGMGAQRWIDLGFMQLQPSELMKEALVMMLAAYYAWLDPLKVSRPLWMLPPLLLILVPMALVLKQPNLGTALVLLMVGGAVMFLAGVSLWYYAVAAAAGTGLVAAVLRSHGAEWQLLQDYQYRRIFTFLDPSQDPLGAGYHITQATIAMGSGGVSGRGFMQGTQSRLNFLPENHTDFIFTTLAEEFGFLGTMAMLGLFSLIVLLCMVSAITNRDRFSALLTGGIAASLFVAFAINMGMVMGLMPVVGQPLPFVSYGGSSLLVLLAAFGLVQSAHIHRPRRRD